MDKTIHLDLISVDGDDANERWLRVCLDPAMLAAITFGSTVARNDNVAQVVFDIHEEERAVILDYARDPMEKQRVQLFVTADHCWWECTPASETYPLTVTPHVRADELLAGTVQDAESWQEEASDISVEEAVRNADCTLGDTFTTSCPHCGANAVQEINVLTGTLAVDGGYIDDGGAVLNYPDGTNIDWDSAELPPQGDSYRCTKCGKSFPAPKLTRKEPE